MSGHRTRVSRTGALRRTALAVAALTGMILASAGQAWAADAPPIETERELAADESDTGDAPNDDQAGEDSSTTPLTIVVVVALISITSLGAIALLRRPSHGTPRPDTQPWHDQVTLAVQHGQALVDQSTHTTAGEPGSGHTLEQLRHLESSLDTLITEFRKAETAVPQPLALQSLNAATAHACALFSVVQQERHLRLASVEPEESLLSAAAHQLAYERGALDQSLQDTAAVIAHDG